MYCYKFDGILIFNIQKILIMKYIINFFNKMYITNFNFFKSF